MAYLLMVVEPRGQRAERPTADARVLYDQMVAFKDQLQREGVLLRAESLRPDEHAVRVKTRTADNTQQLLDGPFAEAKEMVGGFFLIDVGTRDEAIAIARRCPAVQWASVEVRECAPCYVN